MEFVSIEAQKREKTGKGASAAYRREGKLPTIVYGMKEPENLLLNAKDFEKALRNPAGQSAIFSLNVGDDKTERLAIVKEFQRHPLTGVYVHLDLREVSANKPIQQKVHLRLSGTPEGVKMGGTMNIQRKEVLVKCLPSAIPEEIVVDTSHLNGGDSLHVSDIKAPEGVQIVDRAGLTLAMISVPREDKKKTTGEEGEEAEKAVAK